MNLELLEVENNNPNGTLATWLSNNQDNYDIRSIILGKTDAGELYWYIYYIS
ncbi:MAG: hypothetical protein JW837_13745 [Sedimentisphaerales bacterium]|nr:hypothetical protein [Sedimentisphaerales bacterium]